MKDEPEYAEELTDAMHATFTISDEKDKEFRVWAAVAALEYTGWTLDETLPAFRITLADFEKYKGTIPVG